MIITKHDRPIGALKMPVMQLEEQYTIKRPDTHQMTWNQLCRRQGRHYNGWRHRVQRMGWHPLDALLRD